MSITVDLHSSPYDDVRYPPGVCGKGVKDAERKPISQVETTRHEGRRKMAVSTTTLSLTRPKEPQKEYASDVWQFSAGLVMAVAGLMLLMAFFIISAVVAGWVSDQDPTKFGRITAYESWLFPVATASVALAKIGIAVILWGIVRRLWVRVESVKESLPALMKRGGDS
jgi:hypothetical protein